MNYFDNNYVRGVHIDDLFVEVGVPEEPIQQEQPEDPVVIHIEKIDEEAVNICSGVLQLSEGVQETNVFGGAMSTYVTHAQNVHFIFDKFICDTFTEFYRLFEPAFSFNSLFRVNSNQSVQFIVFSKFISNEVHILNVGNIYGSARIIKNHIEQFKNILENQQR